MIRIMATWWNGCGGKMDDHPVHAIQNHHPIPKWMFSQNHPCCWLVRHSRTSPYNDDLCLILVFTVFFLYALVYMYHDYVLHTALNRFWLLRIPRGGDHSTIFFVANVVIAQIVFAADLLTLLVILLEPFQLDLDLYCPQV